MSADREHAGPGPAPGLADGRPSPRPSRLWLWFLAAFALQAAAWIAWFVIASRHQVAEVPLSTSSLIEPEGGGVLASVGAGIDVRATVRAVGAPRLQRMGAVSNPREAGKMSPG